MASYVAAKNQKSGAPAGLLSSVGISDASPIQKEGTALR